MSRNVLGSLSFAGLATVVAAFVLFSPFLAMAPAHAAQAERGDRARVSVHYADLDLHRVAGAAVLYRRIQNAAQQVCDGTQRVGSRVPSAAWLQCTSAAVAEAVRTLDQPVLTGYHRRKLAGASWVETALLQRTN